MKGIIVGLLLVLCGCHQQPTVLLAGDSVSLMYTDYVRADLSGKFYVIHAVGGPIASNDRSSTYLLANIDRIIVDAGPVDVIHFNAGLWDMVHVTESGFCTFSKPTRTTLALYKTNLEKISERFKETGAKVIIATTTPVPNTNRCILPEDVTAFNNVVRKVSKDEHIGLDDLHKDMLPYGYLHMTPTNAHYLPQGSEIAGNFVSQSIEEAYFNQ